MTAITWRGAGSGLLAGFGIALLLQQYAVVPLTTVVLVGLPLGLALVGAAIGWPRAPRPG
jgi:hypothetical protein